MSGIDQSVELVNLYLSLAPSGSSDKCFTGNIYNNDLKLNGSFGTLQSPREPSYYPAGASCDWLITVPEGKIVKLSFDRFELQPSSGSTCTADYVEVFDGKHSYSKSKGKFCGYTIPDNIKSSERYMWVRFRADSSESYYEGFKATYTAEDKPSTSKCKKLIINILVPLSWPIRSKTKTNHHSLAHVFPRFVPATCICFEF